MSRARTLRSTPGAAIIGKLSSTASFKISDKRCRKSDKTSNRFIVLTSLCKKVDDNRF